MVIGAACDLLCAAGSATGAPETVGIAPKGTGENDGPATTSNGGSSSKSGEVDCAVQEVGSANTSGALLFSALGLTLVGVARRRRTQA